MFKPIGQAGQGEREEALGLGAVEGGVGRPGGAVVVSNGGGFDFWVELRPAGGDEFTDLEAGKAFTAGDVIEAGLVTGDESPNGAGGDDGGGGGAEFIREKFWRAALLPGAAEFLVEAAVAGGGNSAVKRSADDGVFGIGEYNLLGGDLGPGIDAERMRSGGFA